MKRVLKNRYEIISIIGLGGMGRVYRARDRQRQGTAVAVKELQADHLPPEKAGEALAQFQTEARILARLSHPNLPKVSDYFSLPGRFYLVMEYVPGRTLEEVLEARQGKPVNERQALAWALQICRTMHFLSIQNPPVVFRDLKPSNIMVDGRGKVKLIDFGIARFFKEDKKEDTYVYGTPGYAAPEQYGTGQTDVRSDIFSLGATLHHCVTGRNPAETPFHFPDPRSINSGVSRGTADLIMKALQEEREKRFQSALDMKEAIQRVLIESAPMPRGVKKIIPAQAGRPIRLPAFGKVCWVSVPVTALGCAGTTGTLSTGDRWLRPRPVAFGPDTLQLLFRVENGRLKAGREYRPQVTIRTDSGILRPRLLFRKSGPWIVIAAVVLAALTGVAMMMH